MRVLITRAREQANEFAEALRSIDATPIVFPTISIQPVDDTTSLDKALSLLDRYDWLIFTSVNAVDVTLERMTLLENGEIPENLRVAAIGPKTAARLECSGIRPDFVPSKHITEAILPGLGDLTNRWVLLPMADIAYDTLPNAVESAGGIPHIITAYHTVLSEPDPEGMKALQAGVDVVTFTSGSTVRNFVDLVQDAKLDPLNLPGKPLIVCIGPKTERTARDLGFTVDRVANPHTTDGLVEAIQELVNQKMNEEPRRLLRGIS